MANAPLTEIQLVLDVLRYEPARNDQAQLVAHVELVKARGLFLESGAAEAWQTCVRAAMQHQ